MPESAVSESGKNTDFDVAVVGAGVVGLAIAWRAALRGLRVAVVDPDPGRGATYASAGMLAPVSEVTFTEEPLLRLGLESLARWPSFRTELEEASGRTVDYRTDGTLEIAYDSDDLAQLDDLAGFEETLGLRVERLTGRECRKREPMLAPSVRGGLLARDDAWVDPRLLAPALCAALARARATFVPEPALKVQSGLVRLAEGAVRAEQIVVATGARSAALLPGLPVRPIKGQILRLHGPRGFLTGCVRGWVHGVPVYLVPRENGEITVGATMEEQGFDPRVTAGGVYQLLRDARDLVPGIAELELAETRTGFRPGTPDNLPLIGATGLPGVYVATGHHRAGVLLSPITADAVAALLTGAPPPPSLAACDPARFDRGNRCE
ncbi:glycine oxidase ThiO [Acrocarpospora pleiomorpha]|uniref:glycine oxidase n=1 Tax=Acrocarpospora pleiomorpha TaxID=90975 RepID=A0A5M3XM82_9ACTN|nr:glycine oxidase ThiO [Acrocarpospora pleiomorpha]GES22002.1 glycine oxidase ThiO [Acrocarpospora pleiomorpha]